MAGLGRTQELSSRTCRQKACALENAADRRATGEEPQGTRIVSSRTKLSRVTTRRRRHRADPRRIEAFARRHPNSKGREMPTLHGDASKEGNDSHGRRRHRPDHSRVRLSSESSTISEAPRAERLEPLTAAPRASTMKSQKLQATPTHPATRRSVNLHLHSSRPGTAASMLLPRSNAARGGPRPPAPTHVQVASAQPDRAHEARSGPHPSSFRRRRRTRGRGADLCRRGSPGRASLRRHLPHRPRSAPRILAQTSLTRGGTSPRPPRPSFRHLPHRPRPAPLLLEICPRGNNKSDMASPINFNQFLEKEKLKSNGSNFTDWFRHVRIFLNGGNLQYVLDAPLGDPPAETETDEVKNVYATRKTRYSQVQCAILCSLESDLQKRFEHHDPHELMKELKTIFETHAAVECYEASKHFFSCMMEEGSSISEHMLVMTGHAKKLSDLGIVIPNRLGINRVLQSLPPSYKNFVMNYNMQNMNKEFPELFGMLKAAEIEIKKEHQVLMVNKTTSFKKQGKSKGKFKKGGKKAATPPMKPKNGPKPDADCYYCKEKGHWKRNCSKYLADLKSGLIKKKKEGMEHWTAVKNILKYLKRTKDMFLCYGGDQELVVTSYTDASWNTDPDDSKSQSGYVFILNGAAVSWASSKQCTVANLNRIGVHSGFRGFIRSELEYGMEFEYLFGVPDVIPDITRSSGMVRRIRFIYRMSFYVNKMMRKVLWKVLEGSRKVRKKPPRKVESTRDSTSMAGQP
ncbi:hypothetical protein QYE76_010699 [Lolium multiflorum]|uniref:CCHC-type domain-containing protein n=1 Tax=Lolium multiflorum TaxID=4521 RepID=A0AAD8TXR9_LOLMU|nr:hypothetical protein QYE76_010699 [Lolium multiflorum]